MGAPDASSAFARSSMPMNAPLPETIRKALESASLDDKPRSGLRRSHKYSPGGAAARTGLGVEATSKEHLQ
jgi:hypothetical protein